MSRHEIIVSQFRIALDHAIDLLRLAGRESLMLVEAPHAAHQPLTTQHLVNSRDAAGERMAHIEDRGIRIRERGTQA